MFSLFSLAITVLSTIIVFVISPTSAVSPPAEYILILCSFNIVITSLLPLMISEIISPGIKCLFLPIIDDITILLVAPTHIKSSIFIISASCAIPFQTLISPVSFQYR